MKGWRFALSSADGATDTAPILLKGSVYDNLEAAASLGYDAIEVHMRETAPLEAERVLRIGEQRGVRIAMLITGRLMTEGRLSLLDDDARIAAQACEGLKRYIEKAGEIGAGIVIGWAKGTVPPGKARAPYMERLARSLRELGEYGLEHGVPVNIEVLNRYETNIFRTARETVDFLDGHLLKNCYVHLDTFHMNIEEANIPQAIRDAGPRLGYFHIADNDRRYPGHGALDFAAIFGALEASGYCGCVGVECLPWPDGATAAKNALAHVGAWHARGSAAPPQA